MEMEPELRKRIETVAAERGVSLRDYVVAALREALDNNGTERSSHQSVAWSQLSAHSFA